MTTNTDGAMPELLPCPFCKQAHTLKVTAASELFADEDEEVPYMHSESYAVICDASGPGGPGGCGGQGGFKPTEAEAVTTWNRRAAIQQAAGAVPKGRSDKDYAIEHAEYMAKDGERLIDAVHDLARAESEHGDGQANESDVIAAGNTLSEALVSLRDGIYEFRKRRDLAASTAPPKQQPVHLGGGEVGGPQWRINKWGNCPLCNRDRIPSEACARVDCPDAPRPESPTGQINKPAGQGMEGGPT